MNNKRQKWLRTKAIKFMLSFPHLNMSLHDALKFVKKKWKESLHPIKKITPVSERIKKKVLKAADIFIAEKKKVDEWDE